MIAKLNELRRSIDAKELAINELRTKLEKEIALLQGEKLDLEKDLALSEKLAREASNSGFLKVKCSHFTFPFSSGGGGDSTRRSYGKKEIRYCEPLEAFALLKKGQEIFPGVGIEFTRVD